MIFVTSETGFIGANFVLYRLRDIGEPILNLDLQSYAGKRDKFDGIYGDICYILGLGETPVCRLSRCAVTGLFFCDEKALGIARSILLSARGELAIADDSRRHPEGGEQIAIVTSFRYAQVDPDTHLKMIWYSELIAIVDWCPGPKGASPDGIDWRKVFTDGNMELAAKQLAKSGHGQYLCALLSEQMF